MRHQTSRSTLLLSEAARHVVYPSGVVSTGWPRVEAQLLEMGIRFKAWQVGVGRLALGKRADGLYAATIGGVTLSIPRQVGKTFLVGALVMALCVLRPGLTVVWTAHRTRTCTRTFQSLQRLAKRKGVAPHVAGVRTANGEQEIRFRNGSVLLFGAREQGFGRGFDEVDIEVFDEAQILTEKALEDMIAATNQTRQPEGALLFYMGTPPRPSDPSEAFSLKRQKALAGDSDDMVYIEMSADSGADPDDRRQWEKANPSFPDMTPLESMLRLRENLSSDESWLREGLGVWDEVGSGDLDFRNWPGLADRESCAVGEVSYGIAVSPDRAWSALGVAGTRADGLRHVDVGHHKPGTGWVPEVAEELNRRRGCRFSVDGGGPAASLIPALEALGLTVDVVGGREAGQAFGVFMDAVTGQRVRHRDQAELNAAVSAARRRPIGDGATAFGRKASADDITALEAVALALRDHIEVTSTSVYEGRGLIEL